MYIMSDTIVVDK